MTKVAHGDTLHGELFDQTLNRVAKAMRSLVASAATGGPASVLPRWRGEIRREILMLPSEDKLGRMSMHELNEVDNKISDIASEMNKYSEKRFREITGG